MKRPVAKAITLLCLGLMLSACSPRGIALSAASAIGVTAAEDRSLEDARTDAQIRIDLNDAWFKYNMDMYLALGLGVYEGTVLAYGNLPNEQLRAEAVRIAWQIDGVKQVINEISIGEDTLATNAHDTLISTSLKTSLAFDSEIAAVNYNVHVSAGNVYIMGIATNKEERQRVIDHAKDQSYVTRVVDYSRLLKADG